MKAPTKPVCHHFFKPSSLNFHFNFLKYEENASLYTLISYFSTSQSYNSETKNFVKELNGDISSYPNLLRKKKSQFTNFLGSSNDNYLNTFVSPEKPTGHNANTINNISMQCDLIAKPNSLLLFMHHSPVKNAMWEARSSIFGRPSIFAVAHSPQNDLIAKTPLRNRTSVLFKFSSDYELRERYRNPRNEIRIGKLVEDLDALAATISYKHCSSNDGTARSIKLVTASMEKMILKKTIRIDTDLTIEGSVIWVGCSSLEIQLEVKQSTPEAYNTTESVALTANFTFVARDSMSGKSTRINAILPETEKEKLLWKEAEERNKMRKEKREQKKDTNGDNVNRLINRLLAEALLDRDSILIKETCLQNSLVCQPEQRNMHGQIFGGFLMRKAFELAYATAYSFAGSIPCFVEVDYVDFLKPVDVGDFLQLKSCVLYTELENMSRPLINVEVVAHVTHPKHISSEVSNNFYFTFTVSSDSLRNGLKIRNVVPGTEEEAWRVIEHIDVLRNNRNNQKRLKE
ncbi:acyl-coenzyme A thioesterase 2, chloroplastic-like [Nicotiana tomentosiformis]|uniref:acyl-coenzyme A thioesterase 2, chloroplastic-like n=1 Tax=Nicotiana tomentosiformis TaxID=4098 RepID=UPI00051BF440|nr:acyl-coenzyme A thioesterase 9, mitochondrial-like isoform X2 [Nicotiana tomentosiformis]